MPVMHLKHIYLYTSLPIKYHNPWTTSTFNLYDRYGMEISKPGMGNWDLKLTLIMFIKSLLKHFTYLRY